MRLCDVSQAGNHDRIWETTTEIAFQFAICQNSIYSFQVIIFFGLLNVMTSLPSQNTSKYHHAEIDAVKDCPCKATAQFDNRNYRAVHDDIKNPDNFLPKAILEPECLEGADEKKACSAWGLSMFVSPEKLNAMVVRVEKTVPGFRMKIGQYAAKMNLSSNEGMRTPATKSGHFDFYAYKTCDYLAQVESSEKY